jgi:hypothetical protein
MFLTERDRAYARGDAGIIRSMDAELRRLGIADTATIADPTGRSGALKARGGRPKLPRCEHNNVAERCPVCNEEVMVS